jgi:hypothetical protein
MLQKNNLSISEVQAQKLVVESDDVAEGLVKLISEQQLTSITQSMAKSLNHVSKLLRVITTIKHLRSLVNVVLTIILVLPTEADKYSPRHQECEPARGFRDSTHCADEAIGRGHNLLADEPDGNNGLHGPVFFMTGELTSAFGVVILQVLMGLLKINIAEQVQEAMMRNGVHDPLDAPAGSWPEVQAEWLLRLALRCCNLEQKRRPTITSGSDWRSLDILQTMATATKSQKQNQGR